MSDWKWVVGFLAGAGEAACEIRETEGHDGIVPFRHMTRLQLMTQGGKEAYRFQPWAVQAANMADKVGTLNLDQFAFYSEAKNQLVEQLNGLYSPIKRPTPQQALSIVKGGNGSS